MSRPLLRLTDLRKNFPIRHGVFRRIKGFVHVINGIDLQIEPNQIFGLVGESGCGKSTLARCIMSLEKISGGLALFDGIDLSTLSGKSRKDYFRRAQMIFQDPYSSLNPRLRVKDIIGEMIRIQGVPSREEKRRVAEMLEQVGLNMEDMEKYPHQFSGGQRQRIAIARALIVRPEFLIADEPVSALDLPIQSQILALLKRLQGELSFSILFISHDLRTVTSFCDQVAVMYLGKIVEELPAAQLFEEGRHPYVQALLKSVPITNPRLRHARSERLPGEVPSPVHLPSGCHFHPRCPLREQRCIVEFPSTEIIGADHRAACFKIKR